MQNFARKTTIPIDAIDFDFVFIDGHLPDEQPEDGHLTYGTFLEGCAWSTEQHLLCESDPKVTSHALVDSLCFSMQHASTFCY